jgi:hypothetical protein
LHASNVALVLNPRTEHISLQFHDVFDDDFTTVEYLRKMTVPPHCWVRCKHCSDYEARGASGNYKAQGASGNYKAWGASGGKYKARMVIFCILAAVNRFSWITWKEESR